MENSEMNQLKLFKQKKIGLEMKLDVYQFFNKTMK